MYMVYGKLVWRSWQ